MPEDTRQSTSKSTTEDVLFWVEACGFLIFSVIAIVGPAVLAGIFGIYWGALAYFATAVVWMITMPCTCMNGGLIFSLMAMPIILGGLAVPLLAGIVYVVSRF